MAETILTLLGLFVSESKFGMKNRINMERLYKNLFCKL
jgi:hypothetical protein